MDECSTQTWQYMKSAALLTAHLLPCKYEETKKMLQFTSFLFATNYNLSQRDITNIQVNKQDYSQQEGKVLVWAMYYEGYYTTFLFGQVTDSTYISIQ